jgi:hypothetical protein
MKKKYQYILVTIQFIISLAFVILIGYSFLDIIRFNKNLAIINENNLSIIIQFIVYGYLAIQLCQMNEPIRWSDSPLLHFVLLFLCFDGVITLPYFFSTINLYLISPLIIGKIHIFSLISSTIFLILCGINQKDTNFKNSNQNIFLALSLAILLTFVIDVNSPTEAQPLNMLITATSFKVFYILINLIAILSFIPSYLKDKTTHNKRKTYSYILFTISLAILRYTISLNYIIFICAILLLIGSSISLIINMKSYSI